MTRIPYEERIIPLLAAIDIAVEAVEKYPLQNGSAEANALILAFYRARKPRIINAGPRFRNATSFKYMEQDVFTYFLEGAGPAVEYFWAQIKAQNLPYKRKNQLATILKRGKLKNEQEYDFVTDTIVPYYQQQTITEAEFTALKQMIGAWEDKHRQ